MQDMVEFYDYYITGDMVEFYDYYITGDMVESLAVPSQLRSAAVNSMILKCISY